ncbi:hypothetical protein [Streptomyces sp. RG80]
MLDEPAVRRLLRERPARDSGKATAAVLLDELRALLELLAESCSLRW